MDPELLLASLLTLAGLVAFIEVLLQLFIKPAMRPYIRADWYGLAINAECFVCGLLGCLLACVTLAKCAPPQTAQCLLTALEATCIATTGFETVKHVVRLATKGQRFAR